MKINIGKYPGKSKKERIVSVRIDPWDTWNMNETLSLIITPMLEQLKASKHGTPFTDDTDAPAHLKGESPNRTEDNYGPAGYNEYRWEWILDEMIWAFKQQIDETEHNSFYHNSDQLEMVPVKVSGSKLISLTFNRQKDPSLPAYYRDDEGLLKFEERKTNGYRLFGKYLESLWD